MDKVSYVYMMASGTYGTLYIGVTSDLIRRVWQHREGLADGFTKQYNVKTASLVRAAHGHLCRDYPREADQGLAARLED